MLTSTVHCETSFLLMLAFAGLYVKTYLDPKTKYIVPEQSEEGATFFQAFINLVILPLIPYPGVIASRTYCSRTTETRYD